MPVMLFVVANWCLTTLLEGEGSFRDVFVATCYGIAPLPLLIILSTAVSNFLTANESAVITLTQHDRIYLGRNTSVLRSNGHARIFVR